MKLEMTVVTLRTAEWLTPLVVYREFLLAALFTVTTPTPLSAEESGCLSHGFAANQRECGAGRLVTGFP